MVFQPFTSPDDVAEQVARILFPDSPETPKEEVPHDADGETISLAPRIWAGEDVDGDAPTPKRHREHSWASFTRNLAAGLAKMELDQYLVLNVAARPDGSETPPYYVQFACGGSEGFRAEAVSNQFLPDRWRLSEKAAQILFGLGWSAPDQDAQPPKVNYWRDWPHPPAFPELAQSTVSTLRRVHGATSPSQLEYRYFDREGTELELEDPGLRREPPGRSAR